MDTVLLAVGGLLMGCSATRTSDSPDPRPGFPGSAAPTGFTVTSSAFADGAPIPLEHATPAAGGRNTSIPLEWRLAPSETNSFVVEVVDLHPIAHGWVHWLVADIPASTAALAAGASGRSMPEGARELANTFGRAGWGGPQPPQGSGPHDYRTTVLALDVSNLGLPVGTSIDQLQESIRGHVLASASIIGTFER